MSDIIRRLPESVANQIAAGEVIQRPSAVIKELVENAVDAGATQIRIFIKDAGKTLIQVVDNGKGMSETDARMAFERHATSKISNADDLFSLHTMGFRGEALPSICAISEVEMRTRMHGDKLGTRIVIEGSKVLAQEPDVCDFGTSVSVKKIFWNVPARRRFLKSDSVELSKIMREFERLALVNNHLRMSIDTGSRTIDLPAGSLKQRIADIWKGNLNLQLLPVEVDTGIVKISGYVSRPEGARRRNPLQYLIVNGRNMRHPYFHKAITGCFDNLIAADAMPCYFIKFEVDPATIDVNIHPTKNEIKFENEQEIWTLLNAAVRATLGRNSAVPSIDFSMESIPVEPARYGETVPAPKENLNPAYNPFSGSGTPRQQSPSLSRNWDRLYRDFIGSESSSDIVSTETNLSLPGMELQSEQNGSTCLQVGGKYIVTATQKGLMLIDQHRAHVKILYERFLNRASTAETVSQQVLFPEVLSLDPSQQLALEGIEDELKRLGFVLRFDGRQQWTILGVPAMMQNDSPKDLIIRIIDSVCDDSVTYGSEGNPADSILEKVALLMARSSAIEGGQRLSPAEMEAIVAELFSLQSPMFSPNGNPIVIILDDERLQNFFA